MIRRVLFFLLSVLPAAAQACPGCNTGVDTGAGPGGTTHVLAGFSWSVLFLVGAALGALGTLGSLIVRAGRQEESLAE